MAVDPLIEPRDVDTYSGDLRVPRDTGLTADRGEAAVVEAREGMRRPAGEGMTVIVVARETGFARPAAHRVVLRAGGRIVGNRTPDGFPGAPRGDRAEDFPSEIREHRTG
ncbi:hypothetical protein [Streptomyces sp. NRRL S-37]|uniref:hypothetical protein n=1 Tax=Streptomyces sp. NRRL S-37 TaxID=1463903 RepID=UPI0004CAC89B|nr:hypothetical protein [Streptomyces sp. NRRL S-37]